MRVVVSLHDVAPATEAASRRWLSLVEAHGARATLLVVPGPWRGAAPVASSPFVTWLQQAAAAGHELALHGWNHQGGPGRDLSGIARQVAKVRGRVLARGCAEFLLLDEDEAAERLRLGLRALRTVGIQPVGFTPPGWLASDGTFRALREMGFHYTTTQRAVHDLLRDVRERIPAFSQRPGSVLTLAAARTNERIVGRTVRERRPFRLALHPDDLNHPELVASVDRMLTRTCGAGFQSCTYQELVS